LQLPLFSQPSPAHTGFQPAGWLTRFVIASRHANRTRDRDGIDEAAGSGSDERRFGTGLADASPVACSSLVSGGVASGFR